MTGLLHRPDDAASLAAALRRVTADGDGNREMGRAARLRYERGFSPEVGLKHLEEGYRAAIAGHGGADPSRGDTHTGSRRGDLRERDGGSR